MNEKLNIKTKSERPGNSSGRLRIGDQWNAIAIIARSQRWPLKAVCELVENSIDAGARNISIVRRKHKGQIFIEVNDDGQGIKLNENGEPDFRYVATHICDSLKRYLSEHQRQDIHGEFGKVSWDSGHWAKSFG
ncbi:MAG: ATP-binding protein [bacterium]